MGCLGTDNVDGCSTVVLKVATIVMESITDGWLNWISEWGEVLILIGMKIRNSPSHDMLARVGGVPWDSLLSFPMDWEAGLKCAQVEQ